jgi:hypothetical protein
MVMTHARNQAGALRARPSPDVRIAFPELRWVHQQAGLGSSR